MKIAVLGQTGQVARELARLQTGADTLVFLGREVADFTRPQDVLAALEAAAPGAIINAAAYTAVDAAEDNEALATQINGVTVGQIAGWAARRDIPFVQISTDYVFDGAGDRPRALDARPAPLGAYGRSKLAGEIATRVAGGRHAILRTSWVFSAHGTNFVKTMLRLGSARDALSIVSDQIGGPTAASDIAAATLAVARQLKANADLAGTYHFAGAPDVSWADFARAIFELAGLDVTVTDIPSADYPMPAARPLNSRLDCSTTTATFGIARPEWRAALDRVITELRAATAA